MDVRLTAEGGAGTDELRSLLSWLTDEDELRGRAALLESPPVPGTLGPVVDGLLVALGPGGAAAALSTALVSWIRHRRSEVVVKVTRPDGACVELSGRRVKLLGADDLSKLVGDTTAVLTERLDAGEDAGGRGTAS